MRTITGNAGDERKYFTQIPHIVDDSDLSVYAVRLYLHLKRVTGESGDCYQSTESMAKKCKMSMGKISQAKRELEDKGFIKIEKKLSDNNQWTYHNITITDLWPENMQKYSNPSRDEGNPSLHEANPSHGETDPSPHELKKNPDKKNPVKNKYIGHFQDKDFTDAWDAFLKMRVEIKHPMTQTSSDRILTLLDRHDLDTAIAMIWRSVENNWRGVFDLPNQHAQQNRPEQSQALRGVPEGV